MDLVDRSLLLAASNVLDTHAHMAQINKSAGNILEDATSYPIKEGQVGTAVQIAERGRTALSTRLGSYRTPLDTLAALNKGLTDRFRELSTALEDNPIRPFRDGMPGPATEDQVARCQTLAADWEHAAEEIRQVEGFENFLAQFLLPTYRERLWAGRLFSLTSATAPLLSSSRPPETLSPSPSPKQPLLLLRHWRKL
ncbi:hypothetical protein FRB93_001530 [Tulasnella sp. JGI-2019a]|nr:hypothetical protein FRB93_001530 [Tulasnella sp. JGI-2019a]